MDIYFVNDQPATCPKCGNRTNITEELVNLFLIKQFHRCLSNYCIFEFVVETKLND